ncbi:DUF2283 domain-containing protein [Nocardioides sp. C4-1]|uniref:DUF2283 domain-containing protein n=1 Tax=Nocardioides sp. C4-1 TaxID=3151851 RepID=UPI003264490B
MVVSPLAKREPLKRELGLERAVPGVRHGQAELIQNVTVRITYDSVANAAYVYLTDSIAPGQVATTQDADIRLDMASINVDFDADGRVLGIEVLGADRILRPETVEAAENITGGG